DLAEASGFWSSAGGSSTVTAGGDDGFSAGFAGVGAGAGGGDAVSAGFIGSGEGGEVVTAVELGNAATGPNTFSSGFRRLLSSDTWPDRSRTVAFRSLISLSLASLAWTSVSA